MTPLSLATGLLVAPTAVFGLLAAFRAFTHMALQGWTSFPFMAGFALCPVVQVILFRTMTFYVLGHELTHSVAAVLCGARVKKMKVSASGGHVILDKSNAFVALAPYFIPLYAVLFLAVVRLASLWTPVPGWLTAAGLGYFLSFHCCMTALTLWEEHQTDLDQAGGAFCSLAWILLANSVVVVLSIKLLYPGVVSMHAVARDVAADTADFWRAAGALASQAALWAASELSKRA